MRIRLCADPGRFPSAIVSPVPRQDSFHTECVRRSTQMGSLLAELARMDRAQRELSQTRHLDTATGTREARQKIAALREQLRGHARQVEESIAEADRLCTEGAHTLSPEQFHALKESRQRLHSAFESLLRQTDSALARLDLATALLLEFASRTSAFQSWVFEQGRALDALRAASGDPQRLEDNKRAFKELGDEIQSKRGELSAISQLAQRIQTEIGAYMDELSRRQEQPSPDLQRHQCSETAQRAQDDYEALLGAKQELGQLLRRVANCAVRYEKKLGEANGWLAELERGISHASLSGDTATRLTNLLRLNQSAVEGQPRIEEVESAARQLDEATVQTDAHQQLQAQHDEQLAQMRRSFRTLSERLRDSVDSTRTEITRMEGAAQGLRAMADWLSKMEHKVGVSRTIPLNAAKLSELKYEDQLERDELESKTKILAELGELLRGARHNGESGGGELEQQLAAVSEQFRRVGSMARAHSDNLRDAISTYEAWQHAEEALTEQLAALSEALVQLDPSDTEGAERLGQELTALEAREWAQLQQMAQRLAQIPNVEQTPQMAEKMRASEAQLAKLRRVLGDKLNSGQRLAEERRQFRKKADQIDAELSAARDWLRTGGAQVASDPEDRREQHAQCAAFRQRVAALEAHLDELDRVGAELLQSGTGAGGKRRSVEWEEGGASAITRTLFDLRRKHDDTGRALAELGDRIAHFDAESQRWSEDREGLERWLSAEGARLDKEWSALAWEAASMASQRNEAHSGLQRMRQQQPRLSQLQMRRHHQLAGRDQNKDGEVAPNELDAEMRQLEAKWDALEGEWMRMDKCIGTGDTLLRDAHRVEKWLSAKEQLLEAAVLPMADEKLVDAQTNIAQMLQSELADERSRWTRFNDDAVATVNLAKESDGFCGRIVARVDDLNRRWRHFERSLATRLNALDDARKAVTKFDSLQRNLRQGVKELESDLNETAALKESPQQRVQLARLEQRLDTELRPALGQLDTVAAQIRQSSAASAALDVDVNERVEAARRVLNELAVKLDSVKRAAESASAAENELCRELTSLVDWAREQQRQVDAQPAVSTEQSRLAEQIRQFAPIYEQIVAKEGTVIVVGSKAASVLSQSPSAELKARLLALNEVWTVLLSASKERQEKLERAKRALDGLVKSEEGTRAQLEALGGELAKLRKEGADPPSAAAALESFQQRLLAFGPSVENVFALMDKLEAALDGGGGAEAKKHRLALEQLRRDYGALLQECGTALEQAKNKELLRARFDSEADSLQSLLDSTHSALKLDGDEAGMGKEALKLALAEFDSRWSKGRRQLQSTLDKLRPTIAAGETAQLEQRSAQLEKEATELGGRMGSRMGELESREDRLEALAERGRTLGQRAAELGETFASLPPIGRDRSVLDEQQRECDRLDAAIAEHSTQLDQLAEEWAQTGEQAQSAAAKSAQLDLERAGRQLDRQRGELAQRRKRIGEMERRLAELDGEVRALLSAVGQLADRDLLLQPLGTDIGTLRAQCETLGRLKEGEMAETGRRREDLEAACRELVRGAGQGVNTEKLESHLSSLNTAWQTLSSRVENRERQLDAAIQALGSFGEAQQSLLGWLDQTEQLMADQGAPSIDHKVVRAQLQNHDFQRKLVDDKKANVEGFLALVQKLEALDGEDEGQRVQLREAGEHIATRYQDLLDGVNSRHQHLQDALQLALEWAELHAEVAQFLDDAERKMHAFERIPTDARKLEEQTQLLEELLGQTQAEAKRLDRLAELVEELGQLVSIEEEQELERALRQLNGRYNGLVTRLEQLSQLMGTLAEDIANFLANTQQLMEWLAVAEQEMHKFDDPSVEPEELGAQSDELAALVSEVADHGQLVTQVVEISRELCTHASGSEALTLQFRTDQLRQRYSRLTDEAAAKITLLERALPLAEDLKEGVAELREHLDGVEEDLANLGQVSLDEQFQLVNTIESDLGPAKEQLEAMQAISVELQRLVAEPRANHLARESADLGKRFNAVRETVSRRADQLRQAERQSRHAFDLLDLYTDWFNDVQEQIVQAEKPAVDMEMLRQQLKQQRALNGEIAAEKNGLREMVVEATRVARELSTTLGGQEGQEALMAKVERAKRLADETAELGAERTAELEQAFALCKELDAEYTEMNEWMDGMDTELRNCDPITLGMPAKALLAQQQHNNSMLQQIQTQRPMVAKFERNVAALSELCSEADEQNLKQIAESVAERFDELTNAFRERGDALSSSIESSSQLADRLNVFLANLSNALDQLRAQEPASCRPPVLRRQIAETTAIFELLRQKEQSFRAMKDQTQEMLAQAGPDKQGGAAVAEMAHRLGELDQRWLELHSGAEYRRSQLEALLPVAEHFWAQLDRAQNSIAAIRQQTDAFSQQQREEEQGLDALEQQLQQKQTELVALQSAISECGGEVQQSVFGGLELCGRLDAEEEQNFVQQHLAVLQSQWDTFLAYHSQLGGNLSNAIDQTLQFHSLLQQLSSLLAQKEAQFQDLHQANPPLSADTIREQMQQLDALRRELDELVINREQLNQLGAELCALPNAVHEVPHIRHSLAELNRRWNRLYAQLGDTQQRLERSLLDMGQFAHAQQQMLAWIAKTEAMLESIDARPGGGLKHVEIELCKLRMLQNDIVAHQPSYDAIQTTGLQMLRQDPQCAASGTQPLLDELAQRWNGLADRVEQLWAELESARKEASSRGSDLDKWTMWLNDLLTELRSNRPVGGLPETAEAQLNEFWVVKADVEQRRAQLEECLGRLEQREAKDEWTEGQLQRMRADWELVQRKLVEREQRLRDALREAVELADGMQEVGDWLATAEERMALVPAISKLVEPLGEQLHSHRLFHAEVQQRSELMKELHNRGVRVQLSCEKKDAIPMKNRLVSLKHRTDKLHQRSADRLKSLGAALDESAMFFSARHDLLKWTQEQLGWLSARESESLGTGERIRELLEEHKAFAEQIQRRGEEYTDTRQRGRALEEHAPPAERRHIEEASEELRRNWDELAKGALRRQRSLEEAALQSGKFDEILAEVLQWLDAKLAPLEAELQSPNHFGDVDTVHTLMTEHHQLEEEAAARRPNAEKVRERAQKIVEAGTGDRQELADLGQKLATLNGQWQRLEHGIRIREERLTSALKRAVDLSEMMHELNASLQDVEARVRRPVLPWEEKSVLAEQTELDKLRAEFFAHSSEFEKVLELAKELHRNAHPRAEMPLRELIRALTGRWELLEHLVDDRAEKLRNRLEEIRAHERKLGELLQFVEEKQGQLEVMRECSDEGQLGRLGTLADEQQMFKADLQQRQPELDEVLRAEKKWAPPREPSIGAEEERGLPRRDSQPPSGPLSPAKRAGSKPKLHERTPTATTTTPCSTPERRRSTAPQRKSEALAEQWRHLWNELSQYEQRLRDRKAYLEEMERLKGFTFDEWRERYLAWNDHGKARVSDLFRRIDKSGTGMVPRKLFIDGILASKFPTSELEMGKVADEFDKGDGLISSKEFMNALRFDPKKMRRHEPKTETERIHEEIARETARCTCAHRFPIQHISSERDRIQYGFGFGGSMKRLVRILRSTVMVRVGGGWEALDAFLGKHDPCRAKGRINVDLLPLSMDQHSRPLGAIDRMEEFHRRKDSTGSSSNNGGQAVERLLGYSPGQPGPIMKMREKTERSMAMFKKPNGAAQKRRGSDHSIIDDVYGSSRIPRPSGEQASNSSRPSSRASDFGGSDFGASAGSGSSRIPRKGVRFSGIPSVSSGRNTPSDH